MQGHQLWLIFLWGHGFQHDLTSSSNNLVDAVIVRSWALERWKNRFSNIWNKSEKEKETAAKYLLAQSCPVFPQHISHVNLSNMTCYV